MLQDRKEMREVFQYPLLKAMAHRRTRRFPLGCEMAEGTLRHKSENPAVPLNELETALLCWAGAGITGLIAADMPTDDVQGSMFTSWVGRILEQRYWLMIAVRSGAVAGPQPIRPAGEIVRLPAPSHCASVRGLLVPPDRKMAS